MKDFYYRIAKDERDKFKNKQSKLSAAQIRNRVEEMRARREKEKRLRELKSQKAKRSEAMLQKQKLLHL